MKPRKKFRGKRRYFRKLHRKAAQFSIDLREGNWFDLWHEHFDWEGYGEFSVRHRREHLAAMFVAFERAVRQLAGFKGPAQVLISIAPQHLSDNDALYVHTPNPNGTPFPFDFGGVRWGIQVPELLRSFMRPEWEVGEIPQEDGSKWLAVRPRNALNQEPLIGS